MKSKTTIFIFLAFFLGGVLWGIGPSYFKATPRVPVTAQDPAETKNQIDQELSTFTRLAEELKPSVVNISVVKKRRSLREASGQGSGVIISSDGDVLTNNHVVDGAKTISVKLADGRELEAVVVGTDSTTDLALLKLDQAKELPVARLGNSSSAKVGEWVMAIGNPYGLEATVTVGVLSGKGRVIGASPYDDFLQTDASINPGNSGGPLFNTKGEVIGINTAIVPGGAGIGFSIPINLAREVSESLKKEGRVARGFIGVGIQALTPALKSALVMPEGVKGALVASIVPNSPADVAGLEVSDVIVAVDNHRISSDRELLYRVAKLKIGSEVPFTLLRDGTEQTAFLRIVERPSPETAAVDYPNDDPGSQARVGVSVTDSIGMEEPTVVVTSVVPGSPAERAGLRRGDQIRAVGAKAVSTAHQFVNEVSKVEGDLALLIERQGRTTFMVVKN